MMNKKDVIDLARLAKKYGCVEALFVTGERPEQKYQEAKEWLKGAEQGKKLTTTSAKVLQKEIISQKPSDWWQNIWTAKRR